MALRDPRWQRQPQAAQTGAQSGSVRVRTAMGQQLPEPDHQNDQKEVKHASFTSDFRVTPDFPYILLSSGFGAVFSQPRIAIVIDRICLVSIPIARLLLAVIAATWATR
jgi:hypothetical protein